MKNQELKSLLNILYEMEGLTDMAIRRGEESPIGILKLIVEKAEYVSQITSAWSLVDDDKETDQCADYAVDSGEEQESIDNQLLQSALLVGVNDAEPDEDIEVEFVYDSAIDEEQDAYEDDVDDVDDESVQPPLNFDFTDAIETTSQENDEPKDVNPMSTLFDASAFDTDDDDDNDNVVVQEVVNEDVDDCIYEYSDEAESDETSDYSDDDEGDFLSIYTESSDAADTIDRPDIRKMFSVNDRYRFRRELFSNSEVDFVDNLNLVQAMSCYEDAEDYFYNDLQWDAESDDVVEFMSIIFRYFNS